MNFLFFIVEKWQCGISSFPAKAVDMGVGCQTNKMNNDYNVRLL